MTYSLIGITLQGIWAYGFIIIALKYGWGLEPKSWGWIIFAYFMAHLAWPVLVAIRIKYIEKLVDEK